MNALRQIAVPGVLGLSLMVGVVGCQNERHDEIPPTALMASEGDEKLAYMAPSDGEVYVYDTETDRMVYSGTIEKGQTIQVDPEKDRVSIDGNTKLERALNNGNQHRIFFQRDKAAEAETASEVEVNVKDNGTRERSITTETRTEDGERVVEEKRTVETR
jgi:hypothetical protein